MKDIIMPRSINKLAGDLRRKLMLSAATGSAIGAMLLAMPSDALAQSATQTSNQSFQGTGVFVMGGGSIDQTALQDTVTVTSSQAVINWTPNDRNGNGTIDFLPTGLTGLFTGTQDFTVLNRIIPVNGQDIPVARMIALNGNIRSQVGQSAGGSVWFYSPGGILIGANSVVNVGSLVLTSQDVDTNGGLFGQNGEIRFRAPAAGSTGSIDIASGAQINAFSSTPNGAYVALVSPRVVQAGRITADGSVALVAAEVADVRINSGLFDINVTVGTADPNGVVHSGQTGGPSQSGAQPGRAYLVAVPKSQALTMLVSGTIGYQSATSAGIDASGNIVLSAGRNVATGESSGAPVGTGTASIRIADSIFQNDLTATATGDINARALQSCAPFCSTSAPQGQILFASNARLLADNSVGVSLGRGQQLVAGGSLDLAAGRAGQGGDVRLTIDDTAAPTPSTGGGGLVKIRSTLILDASASGQAGTNGGTATGGNAMLSATSGSVSAYSIAVLSNGSGAVSATGNGANGTGGRATINLTGGSSVVASFVQVAAAGRGGDFTLDAQQNAAPVTIAGSGLGGSAAVLIGPASSLTGFLSVNANGFGGSGIDRSGNGTGGTAGITIDNGRLNAQFLDLSANGYGGGSGYNQFGQFASRQGGAAQGGTATLATAGGSGDSNARFVSVSASASGGDGDIATNAAGTSVGGIAAGGNATIDLSGVGLLTDSVNVNAEAVGGNARGNATATGGNATGGNASFSLRNGAAFSEVNDLLVTGNALGGIGTGRSGDGVGGAAKALFDGTTNNILIPSLRLTATGSGGGSSFNQQSYAPSTTIGGSGRGGLVTLDNFGALRGTELTLDASAIGAAAIPGQSPISSLRGGNADGGSATLSHFGGTLNYALVTVTSSAEAGAGGGIDGTTGNARGGTVNVNTSSDLTTVTLTLDASGFVADPSGAAIGSATGGQIDTQVGGGTLTVTGFLSADAHATAQGYGQAISSLGANGGTIRIGAQNSGAIDAMSVDLLANAAVGAAKGTIGTATGGNIAIDALQDGTISIESLSMDANGFGGSGPQGGQGVGGQLALNIIDGALFLGANTYLNANGRSGLSTGAALTPVALGGTVNILTVGDTALFDFANLSTTANGDASARATTASGLGGGGAVVADGRGGSTALEFHGGTVTGQSLSTQSNGFGGSGGNGFGGFARMDVTGGSITIADAAIAANGIGGRSLSGGIGGNGVGGSVEAGFTGGTYGGTLLQFFADGRGGAGLATSDLALNGAMPGIGGEGLGGFNHFIIDKNGSNSATQIAVSAQGFGGDGGDFDIFGTTGVAFQPGRGGNSRGGQASAELLGGSLDAIGISVISSGHGGSGGTVNVDPIGVITAASFNGATPAVGGFANGGTASILLHNTAVSSSLSVRANGIGGDGGRALAGYNGGDGQGGTAQFIIDGGSIGALAITVDADAAGGIGGTAFHGIGGNGGNGYGGTANVQAINGASPSVSANILHAIGTGGSGGDARVDIGLGMPKVGFSGGNGGEGYGGATEFVAVDSTLLIAGTSSTAGGAMLTSYGVGGRGGSGASNAAGNSAVASFGGNGGYGGFGHGGQIRVISVGGNIGTLGGGTLTLQSSGLVGAGGIGGSGIVVTTVNPLTNVATVDGGDGGNGGNGISFGGISHVESSDSPNRQGLIDLSRLSIINDGNVAGRAELIDHSAGRGIHLGSLSISTQGGESYGGRFDLDQVGSGVYIFSERGAIQVDGTSSFDLSGGLLVDANGSGGFNSGILNISASRNVSARHFSRTGNSATMFANSIISNSGWVDFDLGSLIRSSGDYSFDTDGRIDFDVIESQSTSAYSVLDASGGIAGRRIIGGDLGILANNGSSIDVGDATGGSRAIITADGSVHLGRLTTLANDANVRAGGDVSLDVVSIARRLNARSTTAGVTIGGGAVGAELDARATSNIKLGSVTVFGDVLLAAGANILIDSLSTTGQSGISGSVGDPSSILLLAGGDTLLGSLAAVGDIDIFAASVSSRNDGIGTASSQLTAGGDISIEATGTVRFGSADAATIYINTNGGVDFTSSITRDLTQIAAAVGITAGSVQTGGLAQLTTTPSSPSPRPTPGSNSFSPYLSSKPVSINANGSANGGSITIGTAIIGTTFDVNAANNVTIGQASSGSATTIVAGNTVALGSLQSGSGIAINAAQLSGANSSLSATTALMVTLTGSAEWGSMTATGPIMVNAGGTAIGTSLTTRGSGGTVRVVGPMGVTISVLNSAATATIAALNGAISLTNLQSAGLIDAQGRSVSVTSGSGAIDFAALVATAGDARVTSANGNLLVRNGSASGALALSNLGGNLTGQTLSGNSIDLQSTGTISLTGTATATGALAVQSGGLTSVTGIATGRTVDIVSGDIAIGQTARVGTAGTTTLVHLTNGKNRGGTFIGGGDSTSGYSLSGVEMQRLFGNDITITSPRMTSSGQAALNPLGSPDVIVGAFTIQGGGGGTANLGSNGTLRIETPGFARVIGAAHVANASSGNRFVVSASNALQVILGSGSLRIDNASGPAGTLNLLSADIVVATSNAISDLATFSDTAAIDDRLASNDGIASDDGALIGGTIDLHATGNVLIQNSGTSDSYDDRRGFTAGLGGISISLDSTGGRIIINGRVVDDLSGYLTGRDTFTAVGVNGVTLSNRQANVITGVDGLSTINGCAIANPAGCVDFVNLYPVQSNPLINNDDDDLRRRDVDGDLLAAIITLDLKDPAPAPNEPLIDEPITGSGNDDLWVPAN